MLKSDEVLPELIQAVIAGDGVAVSGLLAVQPELACMSSSSGATRQSAEAHFLEPIKRYIYEGDTILHIAAAAYQVEMVRLLLASGAQVNARNRHGDEPLHAAAVGSPDAARWNPQSQAATLARLIAAGANPNTSNKRGVTPLHVAVRTRSAAAVETLLQHGADPDRLNKSGSTAMLLATLNTGRSGSGSAAAKAQQLEIRRLLQQAAG